MECKLIADLSEKLAGQDFIDQNIICENYKDFKMLPLIIFIIGIIIFIYKVIKASKEKEELNYTKLEMHKVS